MRFDVNCILGRWPDGGPTLDSAAALLAAMDRLGIERALVRHSQGWHYHAPEANQLLTEQVAGHGRLAPCWTALPPVTGEMGAMDAWMRASARQGVRAVCLYPLSHGYPLVAWQCDALFGPLAELHYVVLLERAEATWEEIAWLCSRYPGLRVVLLNTGYRVLRPLVALLEAHPNLHVDLSTLANFRGIEDLASRFGSQRLLFGTNQPRSEGAGIVAALNWAELDDRGRSAILAGNLQRILAEVIL